MHANFGGTESIMHVKLKINIVVCCQFDMDSPPPPISKDFDSQGMAASRAAHFPHILRASRQMTVRQHGIMPRAGVYFAPCEVIWIFKNWINVTGATFCIQKSLCGDMSRNLCSLCCVVYLLYNFCSALYSFIQK